MTDDHGQDLGRENLRLARRVNRLETTLEQSERIRDANATLLSRLMDDLDAERQRSRDLLLNVLPARIVARLDAGETHIADKHVSAIVLYSSLAPPPGGPSSTNPELGILRRRLDGPLVTLSQCAAVPRCRKRARALHLNK